MSQNRVRSRVEKVGGLAIHAARSMLERRALRELAQTSPVARALVAVTERRYQASEYTMFEAIEAQRARTYARTDEVVWSIEGPVDPVSAPAPERQRVGAAARRSSTKPHWGRMLYTIVREIQPAICVELGSCFGMSGMYILAALQRSGGRLITFEGSRARAEIAAQNFRDVGFSNHEVIVGDFDRTLPEAVAKIGSVNLAFVDGHHHREPTIRYDALLRTVMRDGGAIVHDDIRWSGEMIEAWRSVAEKPARAVFDAFRIGVVELGHSPSPPRFHTWLGLDHLR